MNDLEGFELPPVKSNYMKLQQGENRFRMLAKPINGYEYWVTNADGSRKPVRVHKDEPIKSSDVEDTEKVKFFWAFPVFDYSDEEIKILELTQRTVIKAILALSKDKDWGSPIGVNGYDIVVTRTGEKLETEYQVQPKPQKPLKSGVFEAFNDMHINLDALYNGEDPFKTEEVNVNDIPF